MVMASLRGVVGPEGLASKDVLTTTESIDRGSIVRETVVRVRGV